MKFTILKPGDVGFPKYFLDSPSSFKLSNYDYWGCRFCMERKPITHAVVFGDNKIPFCSKECANCYVIQAVYRYGKTISN